MTLKQYGDFIESVLSRNKPCNEISISLCLYNSVYFGVMIASVLKTSVVLFSYSPARCCSLECQFNTVQPGWGERWDMKRKLEQWRKIRSIVVGMEPCLWISLSLTECVWCYSLTRGNHPLPPFPLSNSGLVIYENWSCLNGVSILSLS